MTHRRPWLKKASFRFVESRILKHAALVHYTSAQERHEAETLGVTAASAVIPNGLPDSSPDGFSEAFRLRYPQLRGRRIILFLSRLDPKKGLDLLLRAFADVRCRVPCASLVIAGEGRPDFVDQMKADTEALGIARDVVWTGFLAGYDKQAALAESDVFALPSYSENFGIAVAESMAARLPVVISDRVGIHQEVSQARAGLVVPCDAARLADALVTLLTDDSLRDALGAGGETLARRQYSSAAVTQKLIDVYNEVVH
jgi:glycosyltransferase involved in cell wall biosynthesis